jgi:hypothetical protein
MLIRPINPKGLWKSGATFDVSLVHDPLLDRRDIIRKLRILPHIKTIFQEIDIWWQNDTMLTFFMVPILLFRFCCWVWWPLVSLIISRHVQVVIHSLGVPGAWHLEVAHFGSGGVDVLWDSSTTHAHSADLGLIILILTQVAVTEQAYVMFLGINQ